jgi:hypothetical protein
MVASFYVGEFGRGNSLTAILYLLALVMELYLMMSAKVLKGYGC